MQKQIPVAFHFSLRFLVSIIAFRSAKPGLNSQNNEIFTWSNIWLACKALIELPDLNQFCSSTRANEWLGIIHPKWNSGERELKTWCELLLWKGPNSDWFVGVYRINMKCSEFFRGNKYYIYLFMNIGEMYEWKVGQPEW